MSLVLRVALLLCLVSVDSNLRVGKRVSPELLGEGASDSNPLPPGAQQDVAAYVRTHPGAKEREKREGRVREEAEERRLAKQERDAAATPGLLAMLPKVTKGDLEAGILKAKQASAAADAAARMPPEFTSTPTATYT